MIEPVSINPHDPVRPIAPEGSQAFKRCTKCGQEKPATLDYFISEKRAQSGLAAQCRECNAAGCRARYERDREKRLAARRADTEGKVRANAQRREKRATDPVEREKNRVRCLEYAARNRETARERSRKWARENRDRLYANLALRAERLAAAGPGYTDADVLDKLREQGYRCTYCGTPLQVKGKGKKYHVDHMQPIARGGRNDPSNICCTCPSCNRRKHDRTVTEFLDDMKAGRA